MADLKFKPCKSKDAKKLLERKKKENRPPPSKVGETSLMIHGASPMYPLEEPLQTILGPIGKFIPTPEIMPNFPSIGLFGKRRTGKSFCLRDLCFKCFLDIPFGIVLTDTAQNGFWQQYFPKKFVFQGLQMDKLDAIVARQKKLVDTFGVDEPSIRCIVILGEESLF